MDPSAKPLLSKEDEKLPFIKAIFSDLFTSPRELALIYVIAALISFSVYSKNYVMILYLSSLGFDDEQTGIVYAGIGLQLAICTLMLANVSQQIGVKNSLLLSGAFNVMASLVMCFCTSKKLVLVALFLLLPVSAAIGIPTVKLSINNYCCPQSKSLGFTLLFIFSHISGALAGIFIEVLSDKISNSNLYMVVFGTAACIQAFCLLLTLFIRSSASLVQSSNEPAPNTKYSHLCQFVGLLFFVIFFKANFDHLEATFPKFMTRTMGKHTHRGILLAMNSVVFIMTSFVGVLLIQYISNYGLILIGAGISASAGLALVVGSNHVTTPFYILGLAVGESIWNPRLADYATRIASPGQEGFYLAIMAIPSYLGIILAGCLSGPLLEHFCPDNKSTSGCYNVFLIISAMSLTSVIVCGLLKRCLDVSKAPKPLD